MPAKGLARLRQNFRPWISQIIVFSFKLGSSLWNLFWKSCYFLIVDVDIFIKLFILEKQHITSYNCFSSQLYNFNPLSANFTKWSNTFNQFVARLPTNCLSVFDHFVGLAFKGLRTNSMPHCILLCSVHQGHPEHHFYKNSQHWLHS